MVTKRVYNRLYHINIGQMKRNMRQWMADVIRRKEVVAMPVMTHAGIAHNGKTVRQAVCDGQVHYEAVLSVARHYPAAAATTIMDLTTEAEAFGAEIAFSDEAVPVVVGRLLADVDAIGRLEVPSLSAGRMPAYLKASLLAARTITDRPVIGGCIGPFSLAGRLYGMSELMILICEHPDAAHQLLSECTMFIRKYCEAQKRTGAGGVMMAEPAAGLLSDQDCRTFSSDYVRYIVGQVQSDDFLLILHNCGNTGHCTHAMVSTGAAAYHFGNKCQMEEVVTEVPPTSLAMGNIDPVSMFKDGTPEQMRQVVTDLLEKMRDYPNFVLSSGCDIPPRTPPANVDAFFEALDEFNRQ